MAIAENTRLGSYKVLSPLGSGGMGEVYLAQDTRLDRKVALKILPADVAANRDRVRRFVQEAKAAAALNHPNIAHIYEIGEANGVNFIAIEFIDGQTLREVIHRRQPDLPKLLRYLQHTAEGLARAHAAGIVHRDIKPDNIMITRDGHAKILDFGLAKLIEQERAGASAEEMSAMPTAVMPQHSRPGTVLGTVGYMSPEQAQGRVNEIDHRSDIFSFGCILFEAVTGHRAFEGKDALDSLHNIVHAPTPQIRDFNTTAPDDLQKILRRCLEKDPEERYQSIKDVAIELRDLRRDMESAPGLETSVAPSSGHDAVVSSGAEASLGAQPSSLESQRTISTGRRTGTHTSDTGVGQLTATSTAQVTQINWRKRIITFALAALVVAVGLSLGLYAFFKWNRPAPFLKLKVSRITSTGKASGAAISPDGRYIVHVVNNAGRQSLEVRQVATNTNQEIIPPAEVTYNGVTFSQDGNYIYFAMRDKGNPSAALYRKPVLGGEATKLITNIDGRVSLSPDGKRFAFLRSPSKGETAIILADADGANERQIASRKAPDFYRALAWSPDGKVIALSVQTFKGNFHGSVVTVPVAGGEEKPVTSQTWFRTNTVSWLGDGSGLILSAIEQSFGTSQLWYISYPGGEVRQITNDLNDYGVVSLTSDSNSLVTVQREQSSNIWLAPVNVGSITPSARGAFPVDVSRARQITSGSSGIGGLSWTPDGRLTYASAASGRPAIWIMQPDGSGQRQLSSSTQGSIYGRSQFPSVSPDGRYVLFTSDRVTGNPHVWRMDIDGGNPKQVTNGPGEGLPQMTPDGRSVVYRDFSLKEVIWKVSIDGGDATQLTDKTSGKPVISPDGKFIACSYRAEPNTAIKIAVISIDGGAPVKLFDVTPTAQPFSMVWSTDGHALVYVDTFNDVSNLWTQPLDGAKPAQLTDFKSENIYWFEFSRDGKWLALARGNLSRDVVLFSNVK